MVVMGDGAIGLSSHPGFSCFCSLLFFSFFVLRFLPFAFMSVLALFGYIDSSRC